MLSAPTAVRSIVFTGEVSVRRHLRFPLKLDITTAPPGQRMRSAGGTVSDKQKLPPALAVHRRGLLFWGIALV